MIIRLVKIINIIISLYNLWNKNPANCRKRSNRKEIWEYEIWRNILLIFTDRRIKWI